ncbi:hypothetical protein EDD15DRAFT_1812324 [Pisolithus albus]|nr:hypothetical protein EDD15DRAFT_1812324 [Pisolithus albus]
MKSQCSDRRRIFSTCTDNQKSTDTTIKRDPVRNKKPLRSHEWGFKLFQNEGNSDSHEFASPSRSHASSSPGNILRYSQNQDGGVDRCTAPKRTYITLCKRTGRPRIFSVRRVYALVPGVAASHSGVLRATLMRRESGSLDDVVDNRCQLLLGIHQNCIPSTAQTDANNSQPVCESALRIRWIVEVRVSSTRLLLDQRVEHES